MAFLLINKIDFTTTIYEITKNKTLDVIYKLSTRDSQLVIKNTDASFFTTLLNLIKQEQKCNLHVQLYGLFRDIDIYELISCLSFYKKYSAMNVFIYMNTNEYCLSFSKREEHWRNEFRNEHLEYIRDSCFIDLFF